MSDDRIIPPAEVGEESVADILIRARGLIDEPSKWHKGHFTADNKGNYVADFNSSRVASRCVRCALIMAVGIDYKGGQTDINNHPVLGPIEDFLLASSSFKNLATLNDAEETTHADIMALFDRAKPASLSSSQSEGTK